MLTHWDLACQGRYLHDTEACGPVRLSVCIICLYLFTFALMRLSAYLCVLNLLVSISMAGHHSAWFFFLIFFFFILYKKRRLNGCSFVHTVFGSYFHGVAFTLFYCDINRARINLWSVVKLGIWLEVQTLAWSRSCKLLDQSQNQFLIPAFIYFILVTIVSKKTAIPANIRIKDNFQLLMPVKIDNRKWCFRFSSEEKILLHTPAISVFQS